MKLKDRPLEYWPGKRFSYWCRADRNDKRKIHYVLRIHVAAGIEVQTFTSEDTVDFLTMHRIRCSTIRQLNLIDDEWHVTLDWKKFLR